ncbi:hypothetical protein D3C73_1508100 [compost metagenome]
MVHGINYPDETGRDQLEVRLWQPVMKDGVIKFRKPEECTQVRVISDMKPKHFDAQNVESADQLLASWGEEGTG